MDAADVPLQRLVLSVDVAAMAARMCACAGSTPQRSSRRCANTGSPLLRRADRAQPADQRAGRAARGIGQRVRDGGGAAPPAAMIEGMDRLGFDITHVYGLTEVYGPAAVCAKQPGLGRDWSASGRG